MVFYITFLNEVSIIHPHDDSWSTIRFTLFHFLHQFVLDSLRGWAVRCFITVPHRRHLC